jgi:tryptophan synthase alpha chain
MVENLRRNRLIVPVALMTYANPVLRYGIKKFCRHALLSGADGFIVPDLPTEEAKELIEESRPLGLNTIFLASPTSPPSRLRQIAKCSTGFIYDVSVTGITGARVSLPSEVARQVRSIKRMTQTPVCVGFGISRASQVRRVARVADGVIIGSALLDAIGKAKSPIRAAVKFLKPLRRACHG